jgi:hypothetical protein
MLEEPLMSRLVPFIFLASCSNLIDIEVSNYLPFNKFSKWTYTDQDGNDFILTIKQNDSLFAILDWEGEDELLKNMGDFIYIYRQISYSNNDNLIIAFDGYMPYFPYPFVDGFSKEYEFSSDNYYSKTRISLNKDGMRYILSYSYFEKTINTYKALARLYIFAPDSGIVYCELGDDTLITSNKLFVKPKRILKIKSIL